MVNKYLDKRIPNELYTNDLLFALQTILKECTFYDHIFGKRYWTYGVFFLFATPSNGQNVEILTDFYVIYSLRSCQYIHKT